MNRQEARERDEGKSEKKRRVRAYVAFLVFSVLHVTRRRRDGKKETPQDASDPGDRAFRSSLFVLLHCFHSTSLHLLHVSKTRLNTPLLFTPPPALLHPLHPHLPTPLSSSQHKCPFPFLSPWLQQLLGAEELLQKYHLPGGHGEEDHDGEDGEPLDARVSRLCTCFGFVCSCVCWWKAEE